MKLNQILIPFVALLFVCFASIAEAQTLSKSEKKILKKELKAYKKNPEDYAMMKEKTKTKIQELNDEIAPGIIVHQHETFYIYTMTKTQSIFGTK